MASRPLIWVTPLNRAEIANAIHRYVFRGAITTADALSSWRQFESDRSNGLWTLIELPATLWETSISIALRYGPTLGVRTLDSLHVACALELNAQKFWTFDDRQAKLAEAVGLDTTA
jgi:predicted nucleic acid-binding protein